MMEFSKNDFEYLEKLVKESSDQFDSEEKRIKIMCYDHAKRKYGYDKISVSQRTRKKMAVDINHFRTDNNTTIVAYKLLVDRHGVQAKMMRFVERKSRGGKLYQMPTSSDNAGIFYKSHFFDRMLSRVSHGADNRYQAVKIILDELLAILMYFDEGYEMIKTTKAIENGLEQIVLPTTLGLCLGVRKGNISLLNTFISEDMLYHSQYEIFKSYLPEIKRMRKTNMSYDEYHARQTIQAINLADRLTDKLLEGVTDEVLRELEKQMDGKPHDAELTFRKLLEILKEKAK